LLVSLAVAGVAIVAAIAIFAYSQFLSHVQAAKAAELQKEQDAVSADTVRDYIRLKDRLSSGETLLNNHIVLSRFFDELETLTLQNVQFQTLTVTVAGDGSAKVELSGLAKNFNALAVQSNNVAADKLFKSAIFSGIGFDNNGHIKFTLTADIDPSLIHVSEKDAAAQPAAAVQPLAQPDASAATTTP
jgi:Tfp pilus assembly protein PilN